MSVIAAYYYNEGKRIREIAIDEHVDLDKGRSGFCWIELLEPTAAELDALQATYHLHPLAIDNAMHPLCPPKLEVYNGELYIVAQTAELVGDRISYGKTAIFTGHNHLISVRHGNAGALGNLREQLEASPALFGKGVDYVLHAILHRIVDQYLPIFEMIEDDVLAMERRSLDDFLGREEVARIFELRSELTRFQRTLGAMAELVRKLVRGHFPCISVEVRPYFSDVADHVHRVQSMVDGLLQVLSTVFEASSLLEAQRTGVITRQLAAWAAILAVPTAIAGIYGMNFKHMPELDTSYGYFVVLGLIAVLCLLLFVRFKKAKWL
ncbi:magnesium and cobalt transport protein CorA [Rhizobium sp. WYCCWR 11128]|uniref:magnesium and cobalt transport protein CorA n=1 Tax=Rhizobium sp. WYCCWR 11128 TaxID=2749832 RepID=UPI0015D267D8|nr:magnesium and cobalt transport protein CorA [Rhizobium sp. WYCCWR 11128]NYT32535.1 magnesium and cobalt transport protein CorA [Rhizobium sp. WYCCWR 11128]